jgi:diaminopimelate decarboxylase
MKLYGDKYLFDNEIDPNELVKTYGSPLYVYDFDRVTTQYNRLKAAFGDLEIGVHYACKANNNISLLQHLHQLGSGLDCVSIYEVQLGLKAGFLPDQIIFTPNGVGIDEVFEAAKLGVNINIDSISILEQFGQAMPQVPVCLRINPHIMAGGNENISVGHIDSKFGISIHQLPHVHRVVKMTGQRIAGLHMHTGSDILDIGVFLQGAEILFNAAAQFTELDFIDFGSGFKVPYKPDDYATDIEELGRDLGNRFKEFSASYGRPLKLQFEPGKFLISEAGYFLVHVNVVKQTISSVFVGVNSGFNHLIRPMMYGSYHHIVNITNPDEKPRIYHIVGYICETDTFASNRILHEVIEGDLLCFYNAGAYAFAMSSNYNLRPRPAEVMLLGGEHKLIRRRETLDDMIATMV